MFAVNVGFLYFLGLPSFGLGVFAAFAVVPALVFFPCVGLALLRFRLCVRWVLG
jgi:hypothetical protein